MKDTNKTILHSAGRFFSGTLISRVSGLGRDIAMAYAFGTQEAVAGFLVAFRLSHLFRRLLGEGALQSAFVPKFELLRSEGPSVAAMFFRQLRKALIALLGILIVISTLVLFGIEQWVPFSEENLEIVRLTAWMLPGVLFICLYGLNAALLQCERSYFTTSVAPVAFNLLWILGVFACADWPIHQAMKGLSVFVVLACLAQWLMTEPKTQRALKNLGIGKPLPWKEVGAVLAPLALGILGVGAAQFNNALDALFARWADPEGPAFLWYAIRIQQLPLALFGVAVSGAILPPLARALKDQDLSRFRRFLDFSLQQSIIWMLPLTLGMVVLGVQGIALIYGRGDFDVQSIAGTSWCLWAYAPGLLPMTWVLLLAPAFYAQGDYKTPARASCIAVAINIALNAFLIMGLGHGAAAVALATSLSSWINAIHLSLVLRAKVGAPSFKTLISPSIKAMIATLGGGLAAFLLEWHWQGNLPMLSVLLNKELLLPASSSAKILVLASESLAFCAGFFGLSYLLRLPLWKSSAEPNVSAS